MTQENAVLSKSRVAIVTGGSRGFGRNVVIHLAKRGVNGRSRYLRFFCEIPYSEARLLHHHRAPEYEAPDSYRAGEEPEDGDEIDRREHAGSSKRGPDERDQRSRCERPE